MNKPAAKRNRRGMMQGKEFSLLHTRGPLGEEVADPGKDLDLTWRTDLLLAAREQSGLYAWYGDLYAEALSQLREAKFRENCLAEDLDEVVRGELGDTRGGKRISETEIKRMVARRPEMRKAWKVRMKWAKKVDRLKNYMTALDQRLRVLQTEEATRRTTDRHTKTGV